MTDILWMRERERQVDIERSQQEHHVNNDYNAVITMRKDGHFSVIRHDVSQSVSNHHLIVFISPIIIFIAHSFLKVRNISYHYIHFLRKFYHSFLLSISIISMFFLFCKAQNIIWRAVIKSMPFRMPMVK